MYIAFAVDSCPCAIYFTMIEPSAAPNAQAESSKKRNATAKPASNSKRQSTIATNLLVSRNSTTSLSISKKGLPAPSASKSHAKVLGTAIGLRSNSWTTWLLRRKMMKVLRYVKRKNAESFRVRCLHCNKLLFSRNTARMKNHLVNPKTSTLEPINERPNVFFWDFSDPNLN